MGYREFIAFKKNFLLRLVVFCEHPDKQLHLWAYPEKVNGDT